MKLYHDKDFGSGTTIEAYAKCIQAIHWRDKADKLESVIHDFGLWCEFGDNFLQLNPNKSRFLVP